MGFKCGIVGLPNVGKSTLFNAITASKNAEAANFPFCTINPNIGVVDVPDERLDKLSKLSQSENGKEITGILTHLVDDTQNDSFQDKFFSGINIDLSKALFIFSYNDPEKIDKILLNRIHRIKFDNLSLEDKLVILKKYIIPEIYKKFSISEFTFLTTL